MKACTTSINIPKATKDKAFLMRACAVEEARFSKSARVKKAMKWLALSQPVPTPPPLGMMASTSMLNTAPKKASL